MPVQHPVMPVVLLEQAAKWVSTTECCVVCSAGDVVQFTLSGTNTGNLRISNLSLEVSGAPITPTTFSCVVAGTAYQLATLPGLAQATIQPGQGGTCSGTYTITTADIVAGPRSLVVTVRGMAATGEVMAASQTVLVTPIVSRALAADVALELCNNATSAGQ